LSNPFPNEDIVQDDEPQEVKDISNDVKEDEGIINDFNKRPSPNDVVLLGTADEFHNDKSSYLVKMFHAHIKPYLLHPEKQFILLTNDDINMTKYTSIWANDPTKENLKFMVVGQNDVIVKDTDMPKIVQPIDARATDYDTDPVTGIQHFPTNILRYSNNDFWKSSKPFAELPNNKRAITVLFNGMVKIKYLGINFVDPEKAKQKFDIIFKTDQKTELGEDVYYKAATDFESMDFDGIQLVTFDETIVTSEIALDFKSDIGAINYVIAIEQEMKPEALAMFLHINRNKQ